MSIFEITIQHRTGDTWPVVVRCQPGAGALTRWSRGELDLDLADLDPLPPTDRQYGTLLGQALFRDHVRDAFVAATAALASGAILRVLLIVEADDLRGLHWHQLCARFGRRWDRLLLNQRTPFSLYLPAEIERRFPPIGRRDLRALILVAGPGDLDGDYGLDPFDLPRTVDSVQRALGDIPSQVLASVEGASGPPTLQALLEHLTAGSPSGTHTFLHIVCHGRVASGSSAGESADTILYFPWGKGGADRRPVPATMLVERLSRLDRLPYLTVLSACESASPEAETGLGGAAQRLVRELGLPAVLAMSGRLSIDTARALSAALYERLNAHGEVDLALSQALAGLQGRPDVTVPALFSRLGERALWSDDLTRPLTAAEIGHGLDRLRALLAERAPVLVPEYEAQAGKLRATLAAVTEVLSPADRQHRGAALDTVNQLCGQALDLSFNALALGGNPPEYDTHCPFRGLYPFRAEDREFFFGRDDLVEGLRERLAAHPFLAILGPSGSGKSSLVLAGLVPALQKREPNLSMAYLTPGSDPVARLEMALHATPGDRDVDATGNAKPPPSVVVVDQFEELFTQCDDPAQRQAFVDRLLALLPTHRLVLTMRADFLGDCAVLGSFKDQVQTHLELVAPLDAAGLRRAMERQADAVGLRFEAGLGHEILEDVQGEPGAMPLLQHALLLLWNRRHGRWLRWQEYQAFGGICGAIAHTADQVYEDLGGREQERLRDILLRLTRLADAPGGDELRLTRRRVPLAELVPASDGPAETQALVQKLADERLLVTSVNEGTGQPEVEVAHEALIQHWPRLRAWLAEDPELARLRQELGQAARAWRDHQRDRSYLQHSGTRLEDLEVLDRQGKLRPTHLEKRYLTACVALRNRRRRQVLERAQALAEQERLRAETERARADDQARATRRLRRRAYALLLVMGIAVILAFFAVLQFFAAQTAAKDEAEARQVAQAAAKDEAEARHVAETAVKDEAEARQVAQDLQATLEANVVVIVTLNASLVRGTTTPRSPSSTPSLTPAAGYTPDGETRTPTALVERTATPRFTPPATPNQEATIQSVLVSLADVQATSAASVGPRDYFVVYTDFQSTPAPYYSIRGMRGDGTDDSKVRDVANQPAISPDGKKVAFFQPVGGLYIWDLESDPEHDTPFHLVHSGDASSPTWAPDGRQLAYYRPVGGQSWIHTIQDDGSGDSRLTQGIQPSWSPTGDFIAYHTCVNNRCGIFRIHPTGRDMTQLTDDNGSGAAVSPDGKEIAFSSAAGGDSEIYVVNADGDAARQLTENQGNDALPAWSPDGRYIYYLSDQDGTGWAVMRMSADGSGQEQTMTIGVNLGDWQPQRIAVASYNQ